MKLRRRQITVVHRSDGSGTSFNFINYLSKVSPDWKSKVGEGTSVSWPVGVGGKGNEGVAAYVKQIKGSIGYVELAYALQNKMSYAAMQNSAGKFVQPSAESSPAAAASADWKNSKDFYLMMTNAPGENAWPITATNLGDHVQAAEESRRHKAAFDFFKWAYRTASKRPRSSTTCRCRRRWSEQIESVLEVGVQELIHRSARKPMLSCGSL